MGMYGQGTRSGCLKQPAAKPHQEARAFRHVRFTNSYNSVYNFHHDYRGYGSPLPPDLISNQITNLERVLRGKADYREVPDPLAPGVIKMEAVYGNSTINLVGGDIRKLGPSK